MFETLGVIGVPNLKTGEVPRAYVVLEADSNINEEKIHDFVNNHVSLSLLNVSK